METKIPQDSCCGGRGAYNPPNLSPRLRKGLITVFHLILWIAVSTVAGNLGKFISTQFDYPLTLTFGQLLSTAIYSLPLLYWNKLQPCFPVSRGLFLRFIIPMAILKTFSTAAGHLSIWNISVSYSQTIKASLPFFTVILGRLFFRMGQTPRVYGSLIPIVLGLALATFTASEFSAFGMAAGILSVIAQSIQHIVNSKLMKAGKIHRFELLAVIAKISTLLFLPVWASWDGKHIVTLIQSAEYCGGWWQTPSLIVLDGFLNFLQNILAFSLLNLMMPTSFAVAGAAKRLFIIILSLILFDTTVGVLHGFGISLTILGVLLYAYFRIEDKKEPEKMGHEANCYYRENSIVPINSEEEGEGESKNVTTRKQSQNAVDSQLGQ